LGSGRDDTPVEVSEMRQGFAEDARLGAHRRADGGLGAPSRSLRLWVRQRFAKRWRSRENLRCSGRNGALVRLVCVCEREEGRSRRHCCGTCLDSCTWLCELATSCIVRTGHGEIIEPVLPDGVRAALPFLASHRLDVVRFEGATRSSWLAAQLDCPELRCLIAEVDRGSTGGRADEAGSWRLEEERAENRNSHSPCYKSTRTRWRRWTILFGTRRPSEPGGDRSICFRCRARFNREGPRGKFFLEGLWDRRGYRASGVQRTWPRWFCFFGAGFRRP
jgi:hypothetical protein